MDVSKGFLLAAGIIGLSSPLFAAEVQTDTTAVIRFENRDVTGGDRQSLVPATVLLGLDAAKLADGNLSLHLSGWGRYDLGDNSYNKDSAGGYLTYGYLRYRFNAANADIRAGRIAVREGIVNELVDGTSLRTDLPYGFGISAFGGATVHNRNLPGETSDGKGNGIAGGRFGYRYGGLLDVGISGVFESNAPALQLHSNSNYRRYGGDVWLSPHRMIELTGHSSYNPETKKTADHSWRVNITPQQGLTLTGEFDEYNERSYLSSWAVMNAAAIDPSHTSRITGGRASWQLSKTALLSADYRHYSREAGAADRFGGELKLTGFDNSLRSGIGYHYLNADRNFAIISTASASYHEVRAYVLRDTKTYFASLDALGYLFKEKIYGENNSWELLASLGYHLTPALAVSGDVSHGRNPEFTSETKGLLRLTYNMTFDAMGAKK